MYWIGVIVLALALVGIGAGRVVKAFEDEANGPGIITDDSGPGIISDDDTGRR